MYCNFYGFSEKPFHITPNPRFLFLSKNHKEAFAHLLYGINNHVGFIELTGEVGTGKTTVLRTLLEQLDENSHRTALIFNPTLSALELLRNINREFGIPCEGLDTAQLLEELNLFLLAEHREGRTVVLVIDEAQNLAPQVMEQIRLISNLETETDKLIQIVLAGQPELGQLLERTELRQLSQRIAVRYHLLPMDYADTRAYMEHRLNVARPNGTPLFSSAASRRIYYYSGGSPRLINIACDRSLLIGYAEDSRRITGRMAAAAIRELRGQSRLVITPRQRLWAGAIVISCAAAITLFTMIKRGPQAPAMTADAQAARPVADLKSPPVPVKTAPASLPQPQKGTVNSASPALLSLAASTGPMENKPLLSDGKESPWLDLPQGPLPAFNALARLWNETPASPGNGQTNLAELARSKNLELTPLSSRIKTLQALDTPAILAIKPPGAKQVRYVAVTGIDRTRVRLAPAPPGHAVVSRAELEKMWTGQGQLLWKNYQKIPTSLPAEAAGVEAIRLQILLTGAGYFRGEPTGVFDEGTVAALKAYQTARKIKADGRPGATTLLMLYRDGGKFFVPRLGERGGDR